MKRLLAGMAVGLLCAGPVLAKEMSVQVRNGQLRADPSFLGKLVTSVDYGARVNVAEERGDWRRVALPDGTSGWIHQSALTPKKIVMQAGSADVSTAASGQELALAGKGFNSDVEADFKRKNAEIDFTWIDRMEKIKFTAEQMSAFLRDGGVQAAN